MQPVAEAILVIEFSALLWLFVDSTARASLSLFFSPSVSYSNTGRALIDAAVETALVAYQSLIQVAVFLMANARSVALLLASAVLSVLLVSFGPEVLAFVADAYHAAHPLVAAPALAVLNLLRLAFDAAIGLTNVASLALGAPLWAAARQVGQCAVGGPHATLAVNIGRLGRSLSMLALEVNATIATLDPSRPFDGAFVKPLLDVGADLVGRIECVCAFDGGVLSGPIIETLRSPALPSLVGSGVTMALSLLTAPLGAAKALAGGAGGVRAQFNLDPIFDSMVSGAGALGDVLDTGAGSLVRSVQVVSGQTHQAQSS